MAIYTGRYKIGGNSPTLEERLKEIESSLSSLNVMTFEFEGVNTEVIITHNKGRKVSTTFINRDGDYSPVDVHHIDDNSLEVSSVILLDGFLLVF